MDPNSQPTPTLSEAPVSGEPRIACPKCGKAINVYNHQRRGDTNPDEPTPILDAWCYCTVCEWHGLLREADALPAAVAPCPICGRREDESGELFCSRPHNRRAVAPTSTEQERLKAVNRLSLLCAEQAIAMLNGGPVASYVGEIERLTALLVVVSPADPDRLKLTVNELLELGASLRYHQEMHDDCPSEGEDQGYALDLKRTNARIATLTAQLAAPVGSGPNYDSGWEDATEEDIETLDEHLDLAADSNHQQVIAHLEQARQDLVDKLERTEGTRRSQLKAASLAAPATPSPTPTMQEEE